MVEGLEVRALLTTTGLTGGGQPIDNTQPSLALHYIIDLYGVYPSRRDDNGGPRNMVGALTGEIDMIAGNVAPRDWAFCDGQILKINQHLVLFSVIGTQFGGNGTTTFALPDLRDRAIVGAGKGEGLTPRPVAENLGKDSFKLTDKQIPSHTHARPGGGTVTSGAEPFDNSQPSLALHYLISPPRDGADAQIRAFAGDYAPFGYLFCDGQLLQAGNHPALFQLLGNTYGGNGKTTFALPDLRGRLDVGTGQISGEALRSLGQNFGAETVKLTEAQMPAHTHTLPGGGTTGTAGGGQPFDNTQPSVTMNYMISLTGAYLVSNGDARRLGDTLPFLGEIRAYPSNNIPQGWALADGRLLSIDQNFALYTVLGTTYGGDGVTTFALPDLRGRVPVGAGQGQTNREAGNMYGNETVKLTVAELPAHSHNFTVTASRRARASTRQLHTPTLRVGLS